MPGLSDNCEICKKNYLFSLARCGFCRKTVCADCLVRVGGSIFCGKACGHTFFYGAEEDAEDGESSSEDDAE
jgi:hypothetical protein